VKRTAVERVVFSIAVSSVLAVAAIVATAALVGWHATDCSTTLPDGHFTCRAFISTPQFLVWVMLLCGQAAFWALADAVGEYHGPFLHGFSLAQAPAFATWAERAGAELAFEYAIALERLARDAEARGEYADAVRWWRKLAGQDPLNGRLTVGLMRALVAAGDRAGAIEQASIYEVLIEEEVELPPDRAVVAFAERLRTDWGSGDGETESWRADTPGLARTATAPETIWANGADTPNEARSMVSADSVPTPPARREYTWRRALVLAAVTLLLLTAFWLLGAQPTDSTARRPSEIHSR